MQLLILLINIITLFVNFVIVIIIAIAHFVIIIIIVVTTAVASIVVIVTIINYYRRAYLGMLMTSCSADMIDLTVGGCRGNCLMSRCLMLPKHFPR